MAVNYKKNYLTRTFHNFNNFLELTSKLNESLVFIGVI